MHYAICLKLSLSHPFYCPLCPPILQGLAMFFAIVYMCILLPQLLYNIVLIPYLSQSYLLLYYISSLCLTPFVLCGRWLYMATTLPRVFYMLFNSFYYIIINICTCVIIIHFQVNYIADFITTCFKIPNLTSLINC